MFFISLLLFIIFPDSLRFVSFRLILSPLRFIVSKNVWYDCAVYHTDFILFNFFHFVFVLYGSDYYYAAASTASTYYCCYTQCRGSAPIKRLNTRSIKKKNEKKNKKILSRCVKFPRRLCRARRHNIARRRERV